MVLFSINSIDAGEKSNFSTAAQRQRKLGSHSAYASERGFQLDSLSPQFLRIYNGKH